MSSLRSKFIYSVYKLTSKQRGYAKRSLMTYKHFSQYLLKGLASRKIEVISLQIWILSLLIKFLIPNFLQNGSTWSRSGLQSRKDLFLYTNKWNCAIRLNLLQKKRRRVKSTENTNPSSTMYHSKIDLIQAVDNHMTQGLSNEPKMQSRQYTSIVFVNCQISRL